MEMQASERFWRGARSGLFATCAMSVLMLAARKSGLVPKLPPKKITEKAAHRVVGPKVSEAVISSVATVAHFTYGAAAGGVFGLVPPVKSRTVQGIAYGLLIWVVSYKGWIPGLRIMPPAEKDHRGRALTVLLAHIIYGATLGASSAAVGLFAPRNPTSIKASAGGRTATRWYAEGTP